MTLPSTRSPLGARAKWVVPALVVVAASGIVSGRSRAQGPELRTWTLSDAHTDLVSSLAYSSDGKTLASSSRDGTVKLWDLASARVRLTLSHHLVNDLTLVAISPDGKILASCRGADPASPKGDTDHINTVAVTLSDSATGKEVVTLPVPPGRVDALSYSRDGETFAAAVAGKAAKVWAVHEYRLVSEIRIPDGPVALAPDHKTVAVARPDHTILVIDIAGQRARATLRGHTNTIRCLAFSPDGKWLASGSGEPSMRFSRPTREYPSEVKLWDLSGETPKEWASLKGHRFEILAVAFSPDGRLVAGGGFDQLVRVWNVGTGTLVADVEATCNSVQTIAFSADGASMAAGGLSASIAVWDTTTWSRRTELTGRVAFHLAYFPDGRTLAASLSDGTVGLWDVAAGRVRTVLQTHAVRVRALAVSPDGKRLAAGGADGAIWIWQPTTDNRLATRHFGLSSEVTSLAFSPDGKLLASGSNDATVRLWDAVSVRLIATLTGHQQEVSGVAFSPNGETLASVSHDGFLRLWDVAERKEKVVIPGHTFKTGKTREETSVVDGETITSLVGIPNETADVQVPFYSMAYAPDGRTIATGDREMLGTGGVSLRDAETARERLAFQQHTAGRFPRIENVNALAYSPDGKWLAVAGYSTARIVDPTTGKELAALKTGRHFPIRDVTFSPDGKTLACVCDVVQLWDIAAAVKRGVGN